MGDNQKYVLISYASKDKKYLKYAHQFKKNLKSLGIVNYDITYLDIPKDLNYWKDEYTEDKIKKELICLQKPTLILDKLNEYKLPIICIDIDSKLIRKPILPNEYFDNCFIFRKNRRLLSVTNGFHVHNYTKNSIRFLKIWEYLCQYPELTYLSDHHRLKLALDLINDENRIINNKLIILDGFNFYKDTYIEGLTRVNDAVQHMEIYEKPKSKIKSNIPLRFPMKTVISPKKQIRKSIVKPKKQIESQKIIFNKIRKHNNKFNILICRMDRTGIHGNQRDAFQQALTKFANVSFITNKLPINMNRGKFNKEIFSNKENKYIIPQKLNKLNLLQFDCIFVDCEISMFFNEDWKNIKIPKFATIHDLHASKNSVNYILENNFDLIFTRYKNPIFSLLPILNNYKNKIIWQPGCINAELFKDYNLLKKYNVIMTGTISNSYPLRQKVKNYFSKYNYFKYIKRPKDGDLNTWPIGIEYAKLLNQSKICITDTSKYYYPIMKIYEVTGSNSLLMIDNINELQELGFHSNKHFIPISDNMIENEKLIRYYLSHDNERKKISINGFNQTINKHTSDYRAKEFMNILCDFYNKSHMFPEIGINQYME